MLLTFGRSGIYQETMWYGNFRPIILLNYLTYDGNFVIGDCQIAVKEHSCFLVKPIFFFNLTKVSVQFKSCCTELETFKCKHWFELRSWHFHKTVLAKLINKVLSNILSLCETPQSCRAQVAVRNNSQADSSYH